MAPAVSTNTDHVAYWYCLDDVDPDGITAFQVYENAAAAKAFLATEQYTAYVDDVDPLLTGPPEVTALTPVWTKGG